MNEIGKYQKEGKQLLIGATLVLTISRHVEEDSGAARGAGSQSLSLQFLFSRLIIEG